MVELPPAWDTLMDQVEGNEAPFSCAVIDGQPRLHSTPIPPKADPELALLAQVLRSDAEIPRHVREWLANMMTPGSDATCSLSIKRLRGRPRASVLKHIEAVEYFDELCELSEHEMGRKRAEHETCEAYKITRSTLLAARKAIMRAKAEGRSE